ncbi:MAG: heme-binding protein [Akkermansiaceae bacterium]
MKKLLFFASVFLPISLAMSSAEEKNPARAPEVIYQSQAPLPKGWPTPGPYNKVVKKSYPAYRAAVTGGSSGFAFMRLFRHIKREDIPMTSPVEMDFDEEKTKLTSMSFLYQDQTIGELGKDGSKIEVRDIPAYEVFTYAWMGERSKTNMAKAKAEIFKELAKQKREYSTMRVLGYNGPSVPDAKKTFELQALLK